MLYREFLCTTLTGDDMAGVRRQHGYAEVTSGVWSTYLCMHSCGSRGSSGNAESVSSHTYRWHTFRTRGHMWRRCLSRSGQHERLRRRCAGEWEVLRVGGGRMIMSHLITSGSETRPRGQAPSRTASRTHALAPTFGASSLACHKHRTSSAFGLPQSARLQ